MEPRDSSIENLLSPMDRDTIGEILNISMGSSATTVSTLLDQRVSITTPKVEVVKAKDFHFEALEPAIAVEINYVSGLSGKNVMVLKVSDVRVIVGLLLHTEFKEEDFVLDEMNLGAICEVMNQMMGASSTALSQFLSRSINISPPTSYKIENAEQFKSKYFEAYDPVVAVHFNLMIGDLVNSEFFNLMSPEFARELITSLGSGGEEGLKKEQEQGAPQTSPEPAAQQAAPQPAPQAVPAAPPLVPPASQQPAQAAPVARQSAPQAPPVRQTAPQPAEAAASPSAGYVPAASAPVLHTAGRQPGQPGYAVKGASYQSFDEQDNVLTSGQNSNLNMILSVPLEVTVEIGRTTKKIKEILDFTSGTILELDKQAGSQVDVFVNGKPIAKGDVVVVDDYYGVRITEISSNDEIMKLL
ncbi:MAG TPA: flagellar motor switch phosphatase FliY [Ruminococcaceae bacterium]|nr:flagellar motor switch phosphatase FliY [Oscillospiraceae bacterium]